MAMGRFQVVISSSSLYHAFDHTIVGPQSFNYNSKIMILYFCILALLRRASSRSSSEQDSAFLPKLEPVHVLAPIDKYLKILS